VLSRKGNRILSILYWEIINTVHPQDNMSSERNNLVLLISIALAWIASGFQLQVHNNVLGRHIAFRPTITASTALNVAVPATWNAGNNFGKGTFRFYTGFDKWMEPFPDEDKAKFPEMFSFPKGVYEVKMKTPLGIVFEEIEVGRGVYVQDLVEGGKAERMGIIQPGDVLVGVTAIKVVGAKWERR